MIALPITDRQTGASRASPFRTGLFASGLHMRLLLATGLSGLVWLAVAWALAA